MPNPVLTVVGTGGPIEFKDNNSSTFMQPDSLNGVGLFDSSGRLIGSVAPAVTLQLPAWPGNPINLIEAWDLDGFGNLAPSAPRTLITTAADAVVAASHTWTFANGNFTARDVGGTLTFTGATNAGNNGTVTILTVPSSTTITTSGTQTNETFATVANITAIVTDTAIVDTGPVYAAVNKGAQTNAGALTSWIKTAGNLTFKKLAGSGRVGNLPALHSDGTVTLATTPAVAALAQPMTVAIVFAFDTMGTSGTHNGIFDGLGASRAGVFVDSPTGIITMAGAGNGATTATVKSGTYHTLVAVFNGASSFVRVDGVQCPNVNPTMGTGATGMTLFSLVGGSFPMIGDIVCAGQWVDGTTPAQLEAACAAIVGSTPQ